MNLEHLSPDIRNYIVKQLKAGEILLTNASVGIETSVINGFIVSRPRRNIQHRLTAEYIAGSFLNVQDYEGVRIVKYPPTILKGMAAVIVKPR